ncbi:mRNA-binding protein PUF3 PWA37_001790 [Arxiozyma heterogenica]|uniref:Pumilio homology domain family member 3 n=1 Tax=Arxiozyma heterogenica TaxID=278026 RepID=A0AAN7ZXU1_9SACH|nr:hypothetical protein RI543_002387 [Kazachstania heterogenica]
MDPNGMDAELASIVSSLSALSNPGLSQQQYSHGFSNNNNNNNNKQLGGFRSSSLTLSDNESDLLSQGSTSYLDQNINNAYNTGFGLGSFGYNKQTTYSVGTAPPYVSTYATNTQHNNNNINTNNTGLYVNTNNSSSTQLRNKLSLLDTYSNNLNMNTLNSNDLNSSFNNHNNYNTVNNFSNTNLSYDKENYYAHTIQNITSSATSTTGFFEKFGKSLIEGTKELENEDSTPTIVNTTVNTSANDRMDNEYLNTTNNNTSATNLTNQNVWNQSTVPSFQLQNSAMVDNETSSQNSNVNTNTNNTNTNEPNMNDNPESLQKNDQMKSPPFFFNHSILNNGFLYGNNFSQFPLGSPTSFIPQMFYPLGQHPSIPPQIPPNNNNSNQMNNTGIPNTTNISHDKNNTTVGTTSITATINNNGNNNVPSSIPDYSLPVNNKNLIESNIPIINNINNIDTNDALHDSNNIGLQGVPMIFTSPSSKPMALNMNHHHSQKLQQQHPNKTTTVNKHPRSKNNDNNNNINNDIKKGNLFNSQQIPNTNHITINPGNPYLDPHNTTVTPNFISKLNENTFNSNLDIDESTRHKTTIPSQQNSGYHRSPLLEEIRNNADNKYTLKDIVGHTLEFCKDQYGSRFIQKELATAEPSEKEVVFNELRDHILILSNDVFGNYVIQKFFEYGTPTQKSILVENFKGRMKELSVQMYACRVIQKALEFIKPEERIELVVELSDCVLKMIKDQNGNHVIQKAIECIPIELLPFVLNSLIGHIYHLSTHSYGCRVIQRLLEFGTIKDQTVILDELKNFIPYLLQDQYGNYVIQHILQHGSDDANCLPMINTKQEIIDIVADNVVEFSKHKFASNVVEKAILYGTKEQKNSIISRILPRDNEHAANLEDNAPLILMMKDQFANYVVQKLVTVSEGESKILIVTAIRAYVDKLNNTNALGNRHLASVEKLAALVETIKV